MCNTTPGIFTYKITEIVQCVTLSLPLHLKTFCATRYYMKFYMDLSSLAP